MSGFKVKNNNNINTNHKNAMSVLTNNSLFIPMAKVKNNIKISVDSTDNTNKNHIFFLKVICERLTIINSI